LQRKKKKEKNSWLDGGARPLDAATLIWEEAGTTRGRNHLKPRESRNVPPKSQ